MLEKNGLSVAADILEDYGIDSETDLPVLDQDDFRKLACRGLKPLNVKKLELWLEPYFSVTHSMLSRWNHM